MQANEMVKEIESEFATVQLNSTSYQMYEWNERIGESFSQNYNYIRVAWRNVIRDATHNGSDQMSNCRLIGQTNPNATTSR